MSEREEGAVPARDSEVRDRDSVPDDRDARGFSS